MNKNPNCSTTNKSFNYGEKSINTKGNGNGIEHLQMNRSFKVAERVGAELDSFNSGRCFLWWVGVKKERERKSIICENEIRRERRRTKKK